MRLLLLFFLACSLAAAQGTGKRTCRILFLDGPDEAPQTLFLFDGTNSREVELPRLNLSQVYQLPGGPLRVHLLAKPPADPKALPAGAPSADVPETAGDIYLILSHDPSNPAAPVRIQVIDASSGKLRTGQMLWYNLAPHEVGGVIGSQRLTMKANSRTILDAPASGAADYDVKIAHRPAGAPDWQPVCETKWLHDPRSRSIVFVLGDDSPRTPRVMMFTDYREPSRKD